MAREAEGSLRDAQSLLEQVLAAGEGRPTRRRRRALRGAAVRSVAVAWVAAVLAAAAAGCLPQLATLHEHGSDPQRFCRDLLEHVRHLAVLAATGDASLVAELPEAERTALQAQAGRRSADELQRIFGLLLETDETLASPLRTIDPQLVLEMSVLRVATLPPLLPVDEILARLDAIAGAAPAGSAPAAPSRGTPGAAPPTRAGSAAPAGAAGTLWESVLARVRQERVSLYMTLAAARPLGISDGVLRLGLESEALRREVSGKDTLTRLGAVASEIAGHAVRVEVGPVPGDRAGETPIAEVRRREQETLADPLVQAAVEIFGAEVRGVRDRRSRTEDGA